jgi:tetratricopeptide (TPR) repeat protein
MVSDPLRKAQKDFRKGYYARVLSSLEPLTLSYRDSHLFYFLMGTSCLATGDVGGAATYLRRAEQLNFRHSPTLAALAAVHVRRGETDKAIQLYLDILSREPGNAFAKRALLFIKSNSEPERLAALVKSGGLSALYPVPPAARRLAARYLPGFLLVALAVFTVLTLIPRAATLLPKAPPDRAGLEGFLLTEGERENPVSVAGAFEYVLTEEEALSVFERAKKLFSAWNDEAALVEINRLLLSNAAPSIKSKAETLKGFVREPDFTNIRERYSYADVARSPRMFEGVAVLWKGQAGNVRESGTGVELDLLVGYQDKKNLEGLVAVSFPFSLRISAGVPLEILGRVRPAPAGFRLEGIAVHELRDGGP